MLVKWTEWTGKWTRVRGSVSCVPCPRYWKSPCSVWAKASLFILPHLVILLPLLTPDPPQATLPFHLTGSSCLLHVPRPTTIAIFFYPLSALDDWLLTSSSYPTPKHLYLLLDTHKRKDTRLSGLPAFQLPLTLWRAQDLDQVSYVFDPALSSKDQSYLVCMAPLQHGRTRTREERHDFGFWPPASFV